MHEVLLQVADEWDASKFERRRTLRGGKSGAYIFLTEVESRPFHGQAVLKIIPPEKDAAPEGMLQPIKQHELAWSYNEAFSRKVLPRLIDHLIANDHLVILMQLAAGSLEFSASFRDIEDLRLRKSIQEVIDNLLLTQWPLHGPMTSNALWRSHKMSELFSNWMGYRANEQQSRIPGLLSDLGIAPSDPVFLFHRHCLPNPWLFCQGASPFGDPTASWLCGPAHGDFNPGNILIERRGREYDPNHCYFIDLDHFRPDAAVFYDQCYCMLEDLLQYGGDRSNREWARLVSCIIGPSDGMPYKDDGLIQQFRTWRASLLKVAESHEGRQESVEWQFYIANIAVGLVFSHRLLEHDIRRKNALLYASLNLRRFLEITQREVDWSDTPTSAWVSHQPGRLGKEIAPSDLRTLWSELGNFDSENLGFILISAADAVPRVLAEELARLPLSIILDVRDKGGLFENSQDFLAQASAGQDWHTFNSDAAVGVAYDTGGRALIKILLADQETLSFPIWNRIIKRQVLQQIREAFAILKNKRFYVLVIPGPADIDIMSTLVEAIDGELGDGVESFVYLRNTGEPSRDLLTLLRRRLDPAILLETEADLECLAQATALMYGEQLAGAGVLVPHHEEGGVDRRALRPLDPSDTLVWQEDFDILHDGLGVSEDLQASFERFLRGNEITWGGLREKQDIPRDYYDELFLEIQKQIPLEPNRTINIYHAPGAGGTTLALRLAWDFRRRYPTLRVRRYSPHLIDRMHAISTATNLPLLVVLDANYISIGEMQEVYAGLNRNHIRALLLQVSRGVRQHDTRTRQAASKHLPASMTGGETRRFLEAYRKFTIPESLLALEELVRVDRVRYHTPFFFGVTVFGSGYRRIELHVKDALSSSSPNVPQLLTIIALSSRYSQRHFPISIAKVIIGRGPRDRLTIEQIVGVDGAALLIQEKGDLKIIHPVVAEQMIMSFYDISSLFDDRWKFYVPDLAKILIEAAAKATVAEGEFDDFLQDLFIQRARILEETQPFAPLISELSPEASAEVLKKLTTSFPKNSHFHHHLGRLYDRRLKKPLADCLAPLEKAVDLDHGLNDVHYHGLGIVYRSEAFRLTARIAVAENDHSELMKLFHAVRSVQAQASEAFGRARNLAPDSEYTYISQIEMDLAILDAFFNATKSKNFAEFLRKREPYTQWCAELMSEAEDHLDRVKGLNPERQRSERTRRCDIQLREIVDHRELVISTYDSLLQNPNIVSKDWVRRGLAHQLFRKIETQSSPDQQDLNRLCSLLEDNIRDNPAKNSRDIRLWFRAYRRHRGFSLSIAIQRIDQWAASSDETEAYYYRYICLFVAFVQKRAHNLSELKQAIESCKGHLNQEQKTHAYEWWIGEPSHWPVISSRELGEPTPGPAFAKLAGPSALLSGKISRIERGQLGYIDMDGLMVRFSPGQKFIRGQHEQRQVRFKLGFRYDGLVAWDPELVQ